MLELVCFGPFQGFVQEAPPGNVHLVSIERRPISLVRWNRADEHVDGPRRRGPNIEPLMTCPEDYLIHLGPEMREEKDRGRQMCPGVVCPVADLDSAQEPDLCWWPAATWVERGEPHVPNTGRTLAVVPVCGS